MGKEDRAGACEDRKKGGRKGRGIETQALAFLTSHPLIVPAVQVRLTIL